MEGVVVQEMLLVEGVVVHGVLFVEGVCVCEVVGVGLDIISFFKKGVL